MPEHERFRGYLSLPYLTPIGVRSFKFRCLQDHECKDLGHGKYDKPAGSVNRIYNTNALLGDSQTVVITEGEMGAIVCSTLVGIPAVGVPGVASWKAHHPRLFSGVERVVVVGDNDLKTDGRNPGRELAEKIARDLDQAVVVSPPAGMDLDEWCLAVGPDEIRRKLAA